MSYHNGLKNFSLRGAITFHSILADWLKEAELINLSIFHAAECMLSVYLPVPLARLPMA